MDYQTVETEFSKKWIIENPGLFVERLIELFEDHKGWNASLRQTDGFVFYTFDNQINAR